MSLTPTATATDPSPAYSPTMHSTLVCIDQKTQKKTQTSSKQHKTKTSRGMPILLILSLTRNIQSTRKRAFQTWTYYRQTDIATNRLNRPRGQFSDNLSFFGSISRFFSSNCTVYNDFFDITSRKLFDPPCTTLKNHGSF